MSVFIETPNHQLKGHSAFEDMWAVIKGLSWLTLVVAPWSLLALFLHLAGIVNLSSSELMFVGFLLLSALPQLAYNKRM
ncbi:MAG: hypothetical protein R8M46_06295 [Ghiorsea sp.]